MQCLLTQDICRSDKEMLIVHIQTVLCNKEIIHIEAIYDDFLFHFLCDEETFIDFSFQGKMWNSSIQDYAMIWYHVMQDRMCTSFLWIDTNSAIYGESD